MSSREACSVKLDRSKRLMMKASCADAKSLINDTSNTSTGKLCKIACKRKSALLLLQQKTLDEVRGARRHYPIGPLVQVHRKKALLHHHLHRNLMLGLPLSFQ